MQSTYWLEKVLKMISLYVNALLCTMQHIVIHGYKSAVSLKIISLYVNALLCTMQHIVIHAMQLSGVNSPN
jgi:hypothetical protein